MLLSCSLCKCCSKVVLEVLRSFIVTLLKNFRDLNAAITRMGTLAQRGRIRVEDVEEEVARLRASWHRPSAGADLGLQEVDLSQVFDAEELAAIDTFDRVQIAHVLGVCRRSKSLADAGRELFAASRLKRSKTNDSDRVKKFLDKWGLLEASGL